MPSKAKNSSSDATVLAAKMEDDAVRSVIGKLLSGLQFMLRSHFDEVEKSYVLLEEEREGKDNDGSLHEIHDDLMDYLSTFHIGVIRKDAPSTISRNLHKLSSVYTSYIDLFKKNYIRSTESPTTQSAEENPSDDDFAVNDVYLTSLHAMIASTFKNLLRRSKKFEKSTTDEIKAIKSANSSPSTKAKRLPMLDSVKRKKKTVS